MQKNGKAAPSVAASLIESLPNEGDPQRSAEEKIARNVAWIVYAGTWRIQPILDILLTLGLSQVVLIL